MKQPLRMHSTSFICMFKSNKIHKESFQIMKEGAEVGAVEVADREIESVADL